MVFEEEGIRNPMMCRAKNRQFRIDQLNHRYLYMREALHYICDAERISALFGRAVRLNYEQLSVIGHSFGAISSIYTSFHDERVRGVCIALDPPFFGLPDEFSSRNVFAADVTAENRAQQRDLQLPTLLLQTENMNQKLQKPYKGIIDCFTLCVRKEGVVSLWRGNLINCIRYFPTQALNFAFKELINKRFNSYDPVREQRMYVLTNFLAGGIAGCGSLCFVYPLDLVRTKISTDLGRERSKRQFQGMFDCFRQVRQQDGLKGLYQGFGSGLVGLFIYRAFYFGLYDTGKDHMQRTGTDSLLARYFFAQLIVIISEALTYPLDTVKRELMMQSASSVKKFENSVDCMRQIYQQRGFVGFYKGQLTNIIRSFGSSLTLVLYDEIKRGASRSTH